MSCVFCAQPAFAAPPEHFTVQGPTLYTQDGTISVRIKLDVDNQQGLHDMLKDGASMQLSIAVKLERLRSMWTNVTLSESTFTSQLRLNPLTREFLLTMPGETKPLADRNLERLIAATWHKLNLNLGPLDLLQRTGPKQNYHITFDISLRHTEVPPWLAKALIFRSWDVVDPIALTLPFSM